MIFRFTNVLTFVIFNETLKINPASTSVTENVYLGLEWCLLYCRYPKYVMNYGMYYWASFIGLLMGQEQCLDFILSKAA